MKVSVVGGAGYVGLITAVGLAEIGHQVTAVDIVKDRINKLQAGISPIFEDGLESLLCRNLATGRLRFSSNLREDVGSSEVIFIAVGTPALDNGQADLSQVMQVAEDLAPHLDSYKVIVIKSTVPTETLEMIRNKLRAQHDEGRDFDIVDNPEFLREGNGLYDFFCPARIVVGACSERARQILLDLYQPVISGQVSWETDQDQPKTRGPVPVVFTDLITAQMIKYASNAFLATRISFINEVAELCDRLGGDINEVVKGMGYDSRIGHAYLQPGLGFGGPCLEKDLRALIKMSGETGANPTLLQAVLERNGKQITQVVDKLRELNGPLLSQQTVAVFGLAFKPGTNDVRNSLAFRVIEELEREGVIVRVHDPMAMAEASAVKPHLTYCDDPYEAVHRTDTLLILTDWPGFKELDYSRIKGLMRSPRILDSRNLLDPRTMTDLGFAYLGVGRS